MARARDRHSSGDLALRLVAIARGLEDDFQYNLAKLYRATAASIAYRASLGRPRFGGTLEEEMARVNHELRAAGFDAAIVELLERSTASVVDGGFPGLDEIPNPNVCRHCGQMMVGGHPERCPACGAWHLTFHAFIPSSLFEPRDNETIRAALQRNLDEIERVLAGTPEQNVDQGPWTLRQILVHFVGAQQMIGEWVNRALDEDNPTLSIDEPRIPDRSLDEHGAELRRMRLATIERVDRIEPHEWERPAWQPEFGEFTVRSGLSYLVSHEQEHLAEFEARSLGR
jgi:hypothetical protein